MADRFDVTLEYVDYPVMDRGMNTTLPSRSMVPGGEGPLFKLVQNMVGHDGMMASWFGVFPLEEFQTNGYPTVERNGSYFETTPNGLLNGQCVMYQFWDYPQTWNNSTATTAQSSYGSFMGIVVTSREIWTYSPQDHNWYNATPIYTTPAITVDVNGATGVVTTTAAADANWSQYKIVPGQLIEFNADGNWWVIESVDSDTQLTTDYTGPNLVGDPYTIRRCFGGRNYSHGDNLLYCQVFNGDLYIAGRTLAGAGNGPAVIRVNSIYDTAQTSEYLLAGFDLTGSMSTNGSVVAELWDIKGIQMLPDGRAVIATAEVPSTMTGIVGNRLRYSSNTGNTAGTVSAQEIWVASPAGFVDVVDHAGEIKALGRLGPSTLSVHFDRGISLATYTAQYDPPVSIQASRAKVGCFAPRTLCQYAGQEIFFGSDGIVHAFNGEDTTPLSDETIELVHNNENTQASFAMPNLHAVVDTRREHYRLFFCDNNFEDVETPPASYVDYLATTVGWIVDLNNGGQFYKETYEPHVTSAAFPTLGAADAPDSTVAPITVGGDFGVIFIGVNTERPGGTVVEAAGGRVFYGLTTRSFISGNHEWLNTDYEERPVLTAETDVLDFGKPGIDKTISHVVLWLDNTETPALLLPSVYALYGENLASSLTGVCSEITVANALDKPYVFSFTPTASEKWQFRILVSDPPPQGIHGLAIHRMRVYYQTQGEIEAVNPDL